MANLKLISCRIDEDVLTELDDYASIHSYWSRSYIINSILEVFMHKTCKSDMFKILSKRSYPGKDFEVQIKEKS